MGKHLGLYFFHIMALLPANYKRLQIPGYSDSVDGLSIGCGISFKKSAKKKSLKSGDESTSSNKKMKLDYYFKSGDNIQPSTSSTHNRDQTDNGKTFNTPWKVSVLHTGTKNTHWHFVYISSHRDFKTNSMLGQDISRVQHKVKTIGCIPCLYNYLYSGNGREVITDYLDDYLKPMISCSKHTEFNCNELEDNTCDMIDNVDSGTCNSVNITHKYLITLFLKHRSFTESSARVTLSSIPTGQEYLFRRFATNNIKIAIQTSKMIVFQEDSLLRLNRAKVFYELTSKDTDYSFQLTKLQQWITINGINEYEFANVTFRHFRKLTGKKNNLFFKGPPSTGKSMIIESLINCHFNYTRLTGLNESSSFNFSSLVHSNACLMDEIKVTETLFEVWKLLAAGQTFTSDVKYHDKCEISNCVLYTASNYDIELYCKVPSVKEAIDTRTYTFNVFQPWIEYFNVAPHTWEMFWLQNGCVF